MKSDPTDKVMTDNARKILIMLVRIHGETEEDGGPIHRVNCISNIWDPPIKLPLKRNIYMEVCKVIMRDPFNNHEILRKFNILSYNNKGEYIYCEPKIISDNYCSGSNIKIRRSLKELKVGSVTNNLNECQIIHCNLDEFHAANIFYMNFYRKMFVY